MGVKVKSRGRYREELRRAAVAARAPSGHDSPSVDHYSVETLSRSRQALVMTYPNTHMFRRQKRGIICAYSACVCCTTIVVEPVENDYGTVEACGSLAFPESMMWKNLVVLFLVAVAKHAQTTPKKRVAYANGDVVRTQTQHRLVWYKSK